MQISIGYLGAMGYERAESTADMLTLAVAGVVLLIGCAIAYRWWQQAKASSVRKYANSWIKLTRFTFRWAAVG